eukprot:TRINITY_DN72615_c0_g1_i1.p1 TRINITY_DN72615_c0_g1~~TRINITY_DN72615_c0_g1_i1.p1  ORF type:complete len:554 (+),score=70.68 TRINITY_DN72615_c0_g1_i1:76-1662(+)
MGTSDEKNNLSGCLLCLASNEKPGKKPDKQEEIGIGHKADCYNAVVVAAFGGVRIMFPREVRSNEPEADKSKRESIRKSLSVGKSGDENADDDANAIRVHPFLVFMFCFALYTVQLSCLSCLVLDMDKTEWIAEDQKETPRQKMIILVKVIMVIVVQMVSLREMVGALRPLLFVLNPVTWGELYRPGMDGKFFKHLPWLTWLRIFFDWKWLALLCIVAQVFQVTIAYVVNVMSISIVLASDDVSNVIFNSLVVIYIADLDEYAWSAVTQIFHIDADYYDKFKFHPVEEDDTGHGKTDAQNKGTDVHPEEKLTTQKPKAKKWDESRCYRWFFRSGGGKVETLETCVVFILLASVYIRQVFVLAQAYDTGIVPIIRDVCDLYRGWQGDDTMGWIILRIMDLFTAVDYDASLVDSVHRLGLHNSTCYESKYQSLHWADAWHYLSHSDYAHKMWVTLFTVFTLFILPQLVFVFHEDLLHWLNAANKEQNQQNQQNQTPESQNETVISRKDTGDSRGVYDPLLNKGGKQNESA